MKQLYHAHWLDHSTRYGNELPRPPKYGKPFCTSLYKMAFHIRYPVRKNTLQDLNRSTLAIPATPLMEIQSRHKHIDCFHRPDWICHNVIGFHWLHMTSYMCKLVPMHSYYFRLTTRDSTTWPRYRENLLLKTRLIMQKNQKLYLRKRELEMLTATNTHIIISRKQD